MKKLYLLLGMIILNVVASLTAMERPMPWEKLDIVVNEAKEIDWSSVNRILRSYGKTGDLVNEYRDPRDGKPLLELAVESNNWPAVKLLLDIYNANPNATDSILSAVQLHMQRAEWIFEKFKQHGAKL